MQFVYMIAGLLMIFLPNKVDDEAHQIAAIAIGIFLIVAGGFYGKLNEIKKAIEDKE